MTSYTTSESILKDTKILFKYLDEDGWELLIEAGYVKEPNPYLTPVEWLSKYNLEIKKQFGFWCHLFLKRTICLEIALTLKNVELVKYYIYRGSPVTSKAFCLAIENGWEFFELIIPNLNIKHFLRLNKATKDRRRGELPQDLEFIKKLLVFLENPKSLDELRHVLRILPYGIEDKLSIKKIWYKELQKEPEYGLISIPEPDEPNPLDIIEIRQGKPYDLKVAKYLIDTGHIELKVILEDLTF